MMPTQHEEQRQCA